MQAVINISGEGHRLRPLSCGKCPGLLSLGNGNITSEMIKRLKECGIDKIIVVTGYMEEQAKECLAGYDVQFVSSKDGDGVLKKHSDLLEKEFIYFSSPVYTRADFKRLWDFHHERNAFVTLLLRRGGNDGFKGDGEGRITKIPEQRLWSSFSKHGEGVGIFVMNKDIVRFMPEEGEYDVIKNILPSVIRSGKGVYSHFSEEAGECVYDFATYMRAAYMYLEGLKSEFDKGIFVDKEAVVDKGALLEGPCYVGKGAHIHKGASVGAYSIVGDRCIVKEGSNIKRSLVGEGSYVGKDCALRGCILDSRVALGSNVSIYEQAIVGEGCNIKDDCSVRSFVRIWPEKVIEKGAVVSENIMWGQRKRVKLFNDGVIKGIVNVDITPSFCLKVGECIGTIADMGEVGISFDGSPCAAMLRDSLVSGILATGCEVKDFGEQPLAITRRGVAFYMLSWGVSVNITDRGGEDVAEITIVTKNGADVNEEIADRLEKLFENGDVIFAEAKTVKEREYLFEYKLYYLKNILGTHEKKKLGIKILLACPAVWGRRLIASAAADYGCGVSMYSPGAISDASGIERFEKSLRAGGFDVGFILDEKCEKMMLVSKERGATDENVYEAMCAYLIMQEKEGGRMYLPVTASSAIDKMALKFGWETVRTKNDKGQLMEYLSGGEEGTQTQFIMRFDAVGAVIKLLDFMSERKLSVEALLDRLPDINMAKTYVELDEKDAVEALERIKKLRGFDENNPEGVKITFDKGWVVVVPDRYREVCKVVGEGVSMEAARELCDFCVDELLKNQE